MSEDKFIKNWITIKVILDEEEIETNFTKENIAAGFDFGQDIVKEALNTIHETLKPSLYVLRDRKKNMK